MNKHHLLLSVSSLVVALIAPVTGQELLGPPIPVGSLATSPQTLQVGDKPTLTWSVQYPESVNDVVTVTSTGALYIKRRIRIQVRLVGAAFESQSDGSQLQVKLQARLGETNWQPLFSGNDADIDPAAFLLDETVPAGSEVHFAALGENRDWRTTTISGEPLAALADGSEVPSVLPVSDAHRLESFLSQFVGRQSEVILGPLEVLYLFELGNREASDSSFDMQDLAVVVMFAEAK